MQIFKATILFIIQMLFIHFISEGQCKAAKKDDFSSNTRVTTKVLDIYKRRSASDYTSLAYKVRSTYDVSTYFSLENDRLQINVTHTIYEGSSTSEINNIKFKFNDDSIISKADRNDSWEWKEARTHYKTSSFLLTKNELSRFSSNSVEKIRVVFERFLENPSFDIDVKKGMVDEIKKNSKCLLEEFEDLEKKGVVSAAKSITPVNTNNAVEQPRQEVINNNLPDSNKIRTGILRKWTFLKHKNDTLDEISREYFSNGVVIIITSTSKLVGTFELANNNNMIIHYFSGQSPQIAQIMSVQERILALAINGKGYSFMN